MIHKMASRGADSRSGRVTVAFELPATLWAEQVALVGEFNGWNPTASPLARDSQGAWRVSLELECNRRYEFGYLLNGTEWLDDWSADECVPNRSGGFRSVLHT